MPRESGRARGRQGALQLLRIFRARQRQRPGRRRNLEVVRARKAGGTIQKTMSYHLRFPSPAGRGIRGEVYRILIPILLLVMIAGCTPPNSARGVVDRFILA